MAEVQVGDVVAGWTVEQELGAGGMGRVYLARHPRLPRRDVLKVIAGELATDPTFRQRFLREADVVCGLQHPHVVVVHDRGDFNGLLYIAMQYVPGGDLRRLLDSQSRLPPMRALGMAAQIASALDTAHASGLVHRDVKPENVLLASSIDGGDHAVLADFGISRLDAGQATSLTGTGMVLATPGYAAPEVVQAQRIDGRADQYALACLLFEMLSGSLPFPRENGMAALIAHVTTAPPNISASAPDLPPALDPVLRRGLAKEPGERFVSCSELVAEARKAFAGLHPADSPDTGRDGHPPARQQADDSKRRRLLPAIAAAVLAVALLAAGAVALLRGPGKSSGEPGASPVQATKSGTTTRTSEAAAVLAARREATTAAGQDFARTFFTFDYRSVDRFVSDVSDRSTGAWRDDFVGKQAQLRSTLTQARSVGSANVLDLAQRDAQPDSAVVLASVDQKVTNSKTTSGGTTNRYRVRMTLQLVANRWLVSGLDPVTDGKPSGCTDASAQPEQRAALEQGCANVRRLFGLDYRTLETDLAAQAAVTTGPFTQEVTNVSGPKVRPIAAKEHLVVVPTTLDGALISGDDSHATLLIFLNQTVMLDLQPAPRVDRNRVEAQLQKVGDRWLISGIKAL